MTKEVSKGAQRLCGCHSLHHRFPVKVRGPVDQVEGAEEDGENDAGHLVDLAHAVVRLLGVGQPCRRHRVGAAQLRRHAMVRDGGDGHVLCEVWRVVDARRAHVVGLLGELHVVTFLQGGWGRIGGWSDEEVWGKMFC